MSFYSWVKAFGELARAGEAYCPNCRDARLIARAVGDQKGGWGFLWCPVCLEGIRLCRIGPIPASVPVYKTAEAAEFPEFRLVEPD